MKTKRTLAIIGALGLLAGAVYAQPAPGDESAPQPSEGRRGAGQPDPEMRRKMLTEKYDANKDGKLDDAELAAIGRDIVDGKFGPPPGQGRRGLEGPGAPGFGVRQRGQGPDGFAGERPERPRSPGFEHRRQQGLPPEDRQGFGHGAEGGAPRRPLAMNREGSPHRDAIGNAPRGRSLELPRKSLEIHRKEFLKNYDANGDGKLDATEREAIGRDIEEGKLPPPPLAPPQPPNRPQPPRGEE